MSDEAASAGEGPDPLKRVADAMEAAVQAAKEGASDARATAEEAIPAAGKLLSTLVYNTCYGLSYGVVFPSVFVARTIPKDNPLVHGFVDGARAAIDMVNELKPALPDSGPTPPLVGPDGRPLVGHEPA